MIIYDLSCRASVGYQLIENPFIFSIDLNSTWRKPIKDYLMGYSNALDERLGSISDIFPTPLSKSRICGPKQARLGRNNSNLKRTKILESGWKWTVERKWTVHPKIDGRLSQSGRLCVEVQFCPFDRQVSSLKIDMSVWPSTLFISGPSSFADRPLWIFLTFKFDTGLDPNFEIFDSTKTWIPDRNFIWNSTFSGPWIQEPRNQLILSKSNSNKIFKLI